MGLALGDLLMTAALLHDLGHLLNLQGETLSNDSTHYLAIAARCAHG